MAKRDVYQEITDEIIKKLEEGVQPWKKNWATSGYEGLPKRITGDYYRGINVVLLSMQCRNADTWMTYKQAAELGGQVRKDEKSTPVTFFKPLKIEKAGVTETIPLIRGYNVFNVEQIDDLPDKYYPKPSEPRNFNERNEKVENFLKDTRANVLHGGGRAYFAPGPDHIQMPEYSSFDDAESYYAVHLHELIHWTGHKTRLDREIGNKFGEKLYAREELVAEIGAAFMCGILGVNDTPRDDHASYLASWLKVLRDDKKAIFKASSAAQKASDYLQTLTYVELAA